MTTNVLFVSGFFESDNLPNYTMPFIDRQMESLKEIGLKVIPFSLKVHKSKFNYLSAIPLIKKCINDNNISIIHAHYLYSAIPCILSKNVPLVISLMGTDVLGDVSINYKGKIKNIFSKILAYILLPRCNAVIVKSNQMRNLIDHSNVHVLPNGIDFRKFFPMNMGVAKKTLNIDKDFSCIVFGGNPNNIRKNYNLALQVYKRVLTKYPNTLLIPLFNIPHNKIPIYLNAASCLLLTSFNEGSPNIVKEALACNTPVVAVDVGDIYERIHNLDMCAVCDFDADALAYNVCWVLEKNHRPELRYHVRELDNRLVAYKINKIYNNLLN